MSYSRFASIVTIESSSMTMVPVDMAVRRSAKDWKTYVHRAGTREKGSGARYNQETITTPNRRNHEAQEEK